MTRPFAAAIIAAAVLAATFAASAGPALARPATTHRPAAANAVAPLRSWGNNDDGELGRGNLSGASVPVKVKLPKGVTIRQVRAGCADSVALSSAGHVYAWGDNSRGQLGDGTTVTRTVPVRVKLPAAAKVTAVRAGCDDNLALTSTGRVYAWGLNAAGELGDGTHRDRHRPVLVKLPKNTRIKAISAGCDHSLAITSSGKLLAWGFNSNGQLGNGNLTSKDVPVRVNLPAGATASFAAAGCYHSIAMTSAGLYAWGRNAEGQLGDGSQVSTSVPEQIVILRRGPPIGKLVSLFAGCYHTLALFAKGAVLAWGYNGYGQLGDGSVTTRSKPTGVMLPAGATVKAISSGCDTSYALTKAGQVLAWGLNGQGELGNGNTANSDLPVPVHLPAGLAATAVFSGEGAEHAFALVRRS
jgi:alpha-tubulin suppressor-like RCC1 family protein